MLQWRPGWGLFRHLHSPAVVPALVSNAQPGDTREPGSGGPIHHPWAPLSPSAGPADEAVSWSPQDSPAPRDGAEELGGPVFSTLTPELGGNYLVKTAWDLIFTWGLLFPDDWTLSSHLSWAPLRGSLKCDSRKSSRGSLQNELGWHLGFEPPTRACLFLTPRVLCPSWLLCQPYRSRTVEPKISFCWNSMELGVILVLLSYDFSNPDLWPGEAACVLLWRRSLVMDAGR